MLDKEQVGIEGVVLSRIASDQGATPSSVIESPAYARKVSAEDVWRTIASLID